MTVTWSLVSTMHGLPETVLPCIAHHLNSDAERLHIYLDAPSAEIEAALAAHPRCVVTVCDEAYWAQKQNGRPEGLVRRQMMNVAHARQQSTSDWLFHVDSDEFLVSADPARPLALGGRLAQIPRAHDWVRILPMEKVSPPVAQEDKLQTGTTTIFSGVFRAQTKDRSLLAAAYGAGSDFLKDGLTGHIRGKVGFRRQTKLRVRLHDVIVPPPGGVKAPVVIPPRQLPPFTVIDDVVLLHFAGWTPLQWVTKLVRRGEEGRAGGSAALVQFMTEHPDAKDRFAFFDRVQRLTAEGLSLLADAGLLREAPFDPIALTRETFPGVALDFSVEAFDERLRQKNPDFYHQHNLM